MIIMRNVPIAPYLSNWGLVGHLAVSPYNVLVWVSLIVKVWLRRMIDDGSQAKRK